MKSILRYFLMGLTTLFLMSCGEEKKKEESPRPPNSSLVNCGTGAFSSPPNPVGYSVIDLPKPSLQSIDLTLRDQRGAILYRGRAYEIPSTEFTLPPNTISFAIQIFGNWTRLRELKEPGGNNILATNPLFKMDFLCSSNILVPKEPNVPTNAGRWTYSALSITANPEVKLVVRTGNLPARATITVKPYVTDTTHSVADVRQALGHFEAIYQGHGIDIVLEAVQLIKGSQYSEVSEDFNNSRTAALVSMGEAGKVNIFFVNALTPSGGGRVGIASGIPGSLGVKGRYNGVLVGLTEHVGGGRLNTNSMGATAAHEMGHFLGLFHTTEESGREFDILTDTPKCRRFPVNVRNCPDGNNLMFWSGDGTGNQTQLSPFQLDVIKKSPIAR